MTILTSQHSRFGATGGGGAGVAWPNEPAGMTVWADTAWNQVNPAPAPWNWAFGQSNAALTTDATAPVSPSNVFQITFPTGFVAGNDPVKLFLSDMGTGHRPRKLFVGLAIMVSNPWQGESSGINKILFFVSAGVGSTGSDAIYLHVRGASAPYHMALEVEYASIGPTFALLQNVSNPTFTLGVWHKWELFMQFSTTSSSNDGIVRAWLDGTHVMEYTNMNNPGEGFGEQQIAPVWGGTTDTKTETDFYWFDHLKFSYA